MSENLLIFLNGINCFILYFINYVLLNWLYVFFKFFGNYVCECVGVWFVVGCDEIGCVVVVVVDVLEVVDEVLVVGCFWYFVVFGEVFDLLDDCVFDELVDCFVVWCVCVEYVEFVGFFDEWDELWDGGFDWCG